MIGAAGPTSEHAHAYQPSSFASRRAEARAAGGERTSGQRLVSLGVQEQWIEAPGRYSKGKGQLVRMEYLYDVDHPTRRYRRLYPNGTLEPVLAVHGGEQETEPLGTVRAEGFSSGSFQPGADDPAPQRIA